MPCRRHDRSATGTMKKPDIFLLEKGGVGEPEAGAKLGEGAYSTSTTVGMIEYEKNGARKFMLIDSGMSPSYERMETGILRRGRLSDVTHILMTHFDQDHTQNNDRFPGALIVSAVGVGRSGTSTFGMLGELYPDNYVENENIRFVNVSKTHSRDEMYYIVDSGNCGICYFVGDLMFGPVEEIPPEMSVGFDKQFTIDIVKKYRVLKEMYESCPDTAKLFVGHSQVALARDDLKKYIEMMENEPYLSAMKEYTRDLGDRVREYEEMLNKL